MNTAILIPARYNSSRFPGKPLHILDGKTMIERVAEQCSASGLPVYVLTDDSRIVECVSEKYNVIYDETPYNNGTERCAGALTHPSLDKYDFFINVQGDMPDITPEIINSVYKKMASDYRVVTAYTDIKDQTIRDDANSVKIIVTKNNVKWFGRGFRYGHHHLGIYAYSRHNLEAYGKKETEYEVTERLEQLRWFEKGLEISAVKVDFDGIEINTPEDIEKWETKNKK